MWGKACPSKTLLGNIWNSSSTSHFSADIYIFFQQRFSQNLFLIFKNYFHAVIQTCILDKREIFINSHNICCMCFRPRLLSFKATGNSEAVDIRAFSYFGNWRKPSLVLSYKIEVKAYPSLILLLNEDGSWRYKPCLKLDLFFMMCCGTCIQRIKL